VLSLSVDFLSVLSKRLGIDAASYFTSEVEGEYLIVRPRQYLGSELFGSVHSVVKEFAGEYVSNGKLSHFRIPLKSLVKSGGQEQAKSVKFVRVPADLLSAIDRQLGVLSDLMERLKEEAKNV